jgi:hypothetical protein
LRIKPIAYAIGVLSASACLGIPATFSVYTNADVGAGSLRQAILDANTSADGDTITFDLPSNGRTIVVQNPLPKVTNTLVIDASSQTDVKLVGPGNYIGFEISATSVTIRGITIQNFEQGVRIGGGASNRIEGCSITGHSLFGVALDGGSYHEIVTTM